jgi:hypothetical protein
MNVAIVTEDQSNLLVYFDLLIGYKPDIFDKPQDFNLASSCYDLVYIDHKFKDRTWLDIFRRIPESTDVVVLTTNSLHWYELEFPDTIWKELMPIYHFKNVKHAQKGALEKIKSYADTLNLFLACKKLIKSVFYNSPSAG